MAPILGKLPTLAARTKLTCLILATKPDEHTGPMPIEVAKLFSYVDRSHARLPQIGKLLRALLDNGA